MNPSYNLLDEPWLPVRLPDGTVQAMGLLQALRRSAEITALAETSPPSLVAEYRLLLAIVHRALTASMGTWKDAQRANWYRQGLPVDALCAYLETWRERFWLFHDEHPFMQVAVLATCKETATLFPAPTLSLELFYGTEMFNQEVYSHKPWDPSAAVKALLGYFTFVPGGFFPGKKLKKSEKAGSLTNSAAALPVGETLSKTLCLALHPAPLPSRTQEDLPAWERPALNLSNLRGAPVLASGPNDRYTRQSRAVLLTHETDGLVRWLHFAAGWALGEDPQQPDPMAYYRAGTKGLARVSFDEGRAFWRDLPALVPAPQSDKLKGYQAAPTVDWAASLRRMMADEHAHQPLLAAGLASDQAKLLRWRLEQFTLPPALLTDPERARELHTQIALAEESHKQLRNLAADLTAATLPDPGSKDTRNRARALVDAGPLSTTFFAAAERELWALMALIAQDEAEAADTLWHRSLADAARQAWDRQLAMLGLSARVLQAEARLGPRLHSLLRKLLPAAFASTTETTPQGA
ncbi:CRISPR system Cascade subunit CasA [Paucibacter oligotrophus]|uniref:CRISPR system Cascade subunit CasA n=1 Tax=Roseateles oligotrophus TaxID=1769250 RepID=A0A840LC32_9BURK|nr:type I-E CRISPR-associated protein Cse1/CasA [Roseateles oligotrophus]MBB4842877.1 CRISPR system Cascade subunit CasA [Roseateles oligotrophus]